ncbi:MAG: hypothetical protein H5T86_03395 [Armatimonadetes bacterium]|nr:hypothetical protein [Armatimonadota bacterium]
MTAGKALVTQALSAAAPQPGTREGAIDLLLLGQAAAAFPGEQAIGKAYLIELAQNLAHMKEIGGLWDDPVVSALGISAIRAATGSGVFRGLTAKPEKNAPKSELLEAMTPAELQKALGGKAPKIPDRARNTLSAFIANRARAQFGISVELLKYGVNQAGAYADGSPLAQGAFLMAWERPAWSYGGDAPQPAAGKRAGRQARAQTQKPKRARAAGQPAAGMAARRGDRANK